MASTSRKSSHMELQRRPRPGAPSPLRIVKRYGSTEPYAVTRTSSSHTERSVSDPAGDRSLTVMKRRGERGLPRGSLSQVDNHTLNLTSDSLAPIPSRRRVRGDASSWSPGWAGSQALNVKKTRRTRPFVNGRVALGTQTCRNSLMDVFPGGQGRTTTSETFYSSWYTPEAAQQGSQTPSRLQTNCLPSTNQPETKTSPRPAQVIDHNRFRTSYVLCPYVTVTTECAALEAEQRSVWAAIEVSGRLSATYETPSENVPGIVTGPFIDHPLGL